MDWTKHINRSLTMRYCEPGVGIAVAIHASSEPGR